MMMMMISNILKLSSNVESMIKPMLKGTMVVVKFDLSPFGKWNLCLRFLS